jgi:hypothetical protein
VADSHQRRRVPRAHVAQRRRSVIFEAAALGPHPVRVVSIGELGVGFQVLAPLAPELLGTVVDGKLKIGLAVIKVQLRLLHCHSGVVGAEFVNPPDMLRGAIRLFFDGEFSPTEGSESRFGRKLG